MSELTKLYTYREVAAMLRCSERTVYKRVKEGLLRPTHNGRIVLFTDQEIKRFVENNKAEA